MFEKAEYFRNKLFRNAIFGIVILIFLTLKTTSDDKPFNPLFLSFGSVSILCAYFSFLLNQKLKLKQQQAPDLQATNSIPDSFKKIEWLLSIALAIVLLLGINKSKLADFIALPVITIYLLWLFSELKKVFKYLNTR